MRERKSQLGPLLSPSDFFPLEDSRSDIRDKHDARLRRLISWSLRRYHQRRESALVRKRERESEGELELTPSFAQSPIKASSPASHTRAEARGMKT